MRDLFIDNNFKVFLENELTRLPSEIVSSMWFIFLKTHCSRSKTKPCFFLLIKFVEKSSNKYFFNTPLFIFNISERKPVDKTY